MEISSDTSPAKRSRAKPKVVSNSPAKATSASAKKPRAPRKSPTAKPMPAADVAIVAATLEPTPEDVGAMIATAAYYLAAARNFTPGRELEDWLEAERAVHARLYG